MNIANIFGLHLGCRVKCKGQKKIGVVVRVLPDYEDTREWDIGVQFWNDKKTWNTMHDILIKDCKLLLKPLSKITDEDKAEFQKKYVKVNDFVSRLRVEFYNNLSYDVYKRSTSGWSENTEHKLSIDQLLWLCSKGYDIGLVPDEYKEVEE